jgi:hypothetical protein
MVIPRLGLENKGKLMFTQETIPFWTAIAAVAAGASALMAAFYTLLTFRLVRLQAEPKVIVYVKADMERPTILLIVIENVGRDIAYDVTFKASKPIPSRAFGLSFDNAKPAMNMKEGPLIEGIPAIGPGDCRIVTWGQFGGLSKAIGDEPIIINYTYRSGKRLINGHAKLEVKSYLGTDASEKPTVTIAKSLKELADSSRTIVSLLLAASRDKNKDA